MPPSDQALLLVKELKDSLEKSTEELDETNKIVADNGTQLAVVQSELQNIGTQVEVTYKTVVTGGNGRDSLVSRVLIVEEKLASLEKKDGEVRTNTSARWARFGVAASVLLGLSGFIIALLSLLSKK